MGSPDILKFKKVIKKKSTDEKCIVKGPSKSDVYDLANTFLNISSEELKKNLQINGYVSPTAVQAQVVPRFSKNISLVANAPTGSGKTAAYLIPLIDKLSQLSSSAEPSENSASKNLIQLYCVILVPTQELVHQVWSEAMILSKGITEKHGKIAKTSRNLYKVKKSSQKEDSKVLKYGKELPSNSKILITTPTRFSSLIGLNKQQRVLSLTKLRWLIIDECDKLLEVNVAKVLHSQKQKGGSTDRKTKQESFREQIDPIMERIRNSIRKPNLFHMALLSATVDDELHDWVKETMNSTWKHAVNDKQVRVAKIEVGAKNQAASSIKQELKYCATEQGKLYEIQSMLNSGIMYPCLIFLDSRDRARELHAEIMQSAKSITVECISGDKSESQRNTIVTNFRMGKINLLICTNLLGRGIDFKGVAMVINYDMPPTQDEYIHRVGRTGRCGAKGFAVTLWTNADLPNLRPILDVIRNSGSHSAKEHAELSRLVDFWMEKEKKKRQKFKPGSDRNSDSSKFVVTNRRGQRKLLKGLKRNINSGALNEKSMKHMRAWNPNRLKVSELPSSKCKRKVDIQ